MLCLRGSRILLRDWRPDELEAMHRWLGHSEVTRFLSWGSHTLADSARHLVECVEAQSTEPRTRYFLAIELEATGRVIGDAGFECRDDAPTDGNLGYFLEPEHWGQGYAVEAGALLLEFAFRDLGLDEMRASCDARNTGSERVMQKLGMRREPGREEPGRRAYRITRVEWP